MINPLNVLWMTLFGVVSLFALAVCQQEAESEAEPVPQSQLRKVK